MARRLVRLFIGWTVATIVSTGPIRNYRDVNATVVEETEVDDDSSNEQVAGTTIHFVKPKEDCGMAPVIEQGEYDCNTTSIFQDQQTCSINCDSGNVTTLLCKCSEDMMFFKMFVGCRWVFGHECSDLVIYTTTTPAPSTTTPAPTTTQLILTTITTTTATTATVASTTVAPTTPPIALPIRHGHGHGHDHDTQESVGGGVVGHHSYTNLDEVYKVHIIALKDEIEQLKGLISTQQTTMEQNSMVVQNFTNFEEEIVTIQQSLEGGVEYVEGFIAIRSNQLSLLTSTMVKASIEYVTGQVDTSHLQRFTITTIEAITRDEALEMIGVVDSVEGTVYNFEFYYKMNFMAEMASTMNPVVRKNFMASAFSTVPGIELGSLNIEYFIHRNNRDLRIDLLERHLEELDHFVTKNITQLNTEVDDLFGGMSGTDFNQATEDETVENVEGQLHDLQLGQQANHWNLESLADQVDKLDDRGEINQYLRSDVTSLKEQQNLQEIKQLMMSQELRRIITVQDQKIAKQSSDLARVQAALIEERYLKRIEMEDYERRVKVSLNIEMEVMMAKMESFFDQRTKQFAEQESTSRLFYEILNTNQHLVPEVQLPGPEMQLLGPEVPARQTELININIVE